MDMEIVGDVVFVAGFILIMIIVERFTRPKRSSDLPPVLPRVDLSATVEEEKPR